MVDDNKVNRLLLTRSLELQGHASLAPRTAAWRSRCCARERFDLLLLDMEMPEMDGFEVLEQLEADLQLRDLPVIVTSSLEGMDNVVRCIELGAEDYLPKPVNPVLLKARIGASLEKKRLRDQQKELVRRFATPEVAQDLQQSGFALGGRRVAATVMFSDIRGFTPLVEIAAARGDDRAAEHLLHADVRRDQRPRRRRQPDDRRRPDGDLRRAAAAAPTMRERAVRAALEMIELVELFNLERAAAGQAADPHRHRHRHRRDGGRLHRHAAARDLHLHRRHREPRGAARGAHQGGGARDPDRRRDRAALGGRIAIEPLGPVAFRGKAQPVDVFAVPCGAPVAESAGG